MHPANCLNCETLINVGQNFCPHCGQKTNIHRLSFHEISHEVIHEVTHADKSIFKLLRDLVIKPGVVAREYLAGKRKKYFKPINFFLLVAGIVVFITSSFYTPNTTRSRMMESAAQRIQDPVKKQELLLMANRTKKVSMITGKYSNVINMIATPFLTLLFWVFYRKHYNYTESLVANMYFIGLIMIIYALLIVPLQNLLPKYSTYFIAAFFAFEIIYRGFAYYQFINKRGVWNIVKAYGVSFLITAVWVLITYSLISKYVRTGF